ncbi:type VII secretion protein EccCa [Micromonospora polyrhachis]|uniref:S-DNA-T family DNA segregation ATPase FtsK/SpoIIIE n=1 Tax=Micromonospora polyrhachis TaxID=1282883 RepID=A0A7W7WLS3_9ACTN|nr:type VII secretion protein EccCa [Micromonospora polyrhachis]MBB4956431.1 S-DNA-T family DNA segregation ATPase FtsK/SpoIIIE [Micromonospora polyrhachis]
MSTRPYRRPARRNGPELPHGEISLQEPPVIPEVQPAGLRSLAMILPTLLMTGGFMFMFLGRSLNGPMGMVMLVMMGGGMLSMVVFQMTMSSGNRSDKINGDRRDYFRYLAQTRRQVRAYAAKQRDALAWRHPDPKSLWSLAMTSRLWERRPTHPDFGEIRVGTGAQRLAVRITPLQTKPVEDLEPVCAKALRRFVKAYTTIPDQPVALCLPGFSHVRISGDRDVALGMVRAMLAQLTTFHAPDELRLAVCTGAEQAAQWEWVKWLPHAKHVTDVDVAGPVRLFGGTLEEVERLLGSEFAARSRYENEAQPSREEPFVVVVCDGGVIPPGARLTVSGYRNAVLVDFDGRGFAAGEDVLNLEVSATDVEMIEKDHVGREVRTRLAAPDHLDLTRLRTVARLMARHATKVTGEQPASGLSSLLDLPDLLDITDLDSFDARARWRARTPADRLRVPIGVAADGSPIELDIKESAEGGMGPHGMLIGATGSGKSELLRTLVLALAATHSSETLNFVLVDFKGGATFVGLDRLPHVSALITNLADEAALVDRMQAAVHGELVRRQELLRRAGNFSSVRDYEKARGQGADLDPLPTLFVVVDEFSELIAANPDFIQLFVMIGRLGRSLGVHLLLASQRLEDGRIHQLEGHLSYRIGLRTFSAMESRAVIGVPDAYELPADPGNGYLRSSVTSITRFKAAYVSGPHRARGTGLRREVIASQVVPFTARPAVPAAPPSQAPDQAPNQAPNQASEDTGSTVLHALVDRLVDQGPPAHPVWMPPLEAAPTLDDVLPPLLPDPEHGLRPVGVGEQTYLHVPVGLIDKPFEQMRDLLVVDLAGVGGHVGVAGGPQSGKSTLLRSLVCGLALTHSPRQVQFYCLDFGGGSLTGLTGLPHVGGVAGRHEPERVGRTVAEVRSILVDRERRCADLGIHGREAYRRAQADGRIPEDRFGDVFLVVDGWFTLRQEFEATEEMAREIAARGLNYGVHVMVSMGRWTELHMSMRDKVGTRLELRLGDPVESGIDLRAAAQVPRAPGHGLTEAKLHFLGALPRIDGVQSAEGLTAATEQLVEAVAENWAGERAAAVRTLPASLPVAELPVPQDTRIALGVDEDQLAPVWHDFRVMPHLTVLGDTESGKTNVLRLIARAVVASHTPAQARIMAVDYRRQLFDDVPDAYRLGYSVSPDSTRATAAEALAGLKPRVPGSDITPEQLRTRDWWAGPELYILVDDYELLAGHENPLAGLIPLLPQGSDIGLHMIVARAAAGAMRLSMDPLLRRIQELNTPDVALSCPPTEGPLLGGIKPRSLPRGRALLCTRRGSRLIQTALVPGPTVPTGVDR